MVSLATKPFHQSFLCWMIDNQRSKNDRKHHTKANSHRDARTYTNADFAQYARTKLRAMTEQRKNIFRQYRTCILSVRLVKITFTGNKDLFL